MVLSNCATSPKSKRKTGKAKKNARRKTGKAKS
jgi:hypothetical protein